MLLLYDQLYVVVKLANQISIKFYSIPNDLVMKTLITYDENESMVTLGIQIKVGYTNFNKILNYIPSSLNENTILL